MAPCPHATPPVSERPQSACPCLGRRGFLRLAAGGFVGGAAGLAGVRAATDRPVDVGLLQDYTRDEISEKFIQYDFFVIRHQGRLYACTAICPHKGNSLLRDPQDAARIICSGHESKFGPEGTPLRGPARRGLVRYGIAVNAQGRVIVDPSREFPQAQWEDKASYVVMA